MSPVRRRAAAIAALEGALQIDRAVFHAGNSPKTSPVTTLSASGEEKYWRPDVDAFDERQVEIGDVCWKQRRQRIARPPGHDRAHRAASQREQHAFGEHLPDDAEAASAESVRTASSRRRVDASASNRLATLAHAMSSTNPTPANSVISIGFASPVPPNGSTRGGHPLFVAGYVRARPCVDRRQLPLCRLGRNVGLEARNGRSTA